MKGEIEIGRRSTICEEVFAKSRECGVPKCGILVRTCYVVIELGVDNPIDDG